MNSILPGVAYAPEITAAAERHGLDPRLLAAVAAQETGGPGSNSGRNVVGDGGHGHGLFQIDDRYHAFARSAQAMDPSSNADYAAGMLQELLGRYGGNVREALSAYNAGSPAAEGTVTQWSDGSELGYADSVMRHYAALTGSAAPLNLPEAETPSSADAESLLVELMSSLSSMAGFPMTPPAQQPSYTWSQMDQGDAFSQEVSDGN
jgi:hypothetical protein